MHIASSLNFLTFDLILFTDLCRSVLTHFTHCKEVTWQWILKVVSFNWCSYSKFVCVCNWRSSGVMWSHLRALAAFCTDCTFFSWFSGTPYRSEFVCVCAVQCMQACRRLKKSSSVLVTSVSRLLVWVRSGDWRSVLSVQRHHLESGETGGRQVRLSCSVCCDWSRCDDCWLWEDAKRKGKMWVS